MKAYSMSEGELQDRLKIAGQLARTRSELVRYLVTLGTYTPMQIVAEVKRWFNTCDGPMVRSIIKEYNHHVAINGPDEWFTNIQEKVPLGVRVDETYEKVLIDRQLKQQQARIRELEHEVAMLKLEAQHADAGREGETT